MACAGRLGCASSSSSTTSSLSLLSITALAPAALATDEMSDGEAAIVMNPLALQLLVPHFVLSHLLQLLTMQSHGRSAHALASFLAGAAALGQGTPPYITDERLTPRVRRWPPAFGIDRMDSTGTTPL